MSRLLKATWALALALALYHPAVLAENTVKTPHGGDAARPPLIVSISVCTPSDDSGTSGSCPNGSVDSAQPVLAPDGSGNAINTYGDLTTLADEHSTIFPAGTLPHQNDYLFFVATRTTLNPDASGVVVLTGGSGPNGSGQWTLDFAHDFGLYDPGNPPGHQNGQIFLAAMQHAACPSPPDVSDPTFDLNYGDPGSVFVDPTNRSNTGPGSLVMIYEGTNRCIGRTGSSNKGNNFYSTIGVATSLDHGHTWPTYRSNFNSLYELPLLNPSDGPAAPFGALGESVCTGNDCTTTPPAEYGRYAILSPVVTVADAITRTNGNDLASNVGDSEPSAFVDDVGTRPDPYVYVVHNYAPGPFGGNMLSDNTPLPDGVASDLAVARARLNGGRSPLAFTKWYQGSFSERGLGSDGGGRESPVFPALDSSLYKNCLAPDQARAMGSISYVEETQQYLLTFVCASPGDPLAATSDPGGGQTGAAWFYSTMDAIRLDLSDQRQWSRPQEIIGSWSQFTGTIGVNGCFRNFDGWYPSFMSLHHKPGHLSTTGYVFYMKGCTDNDTPEGRQFSTRAFTITTETKSRDDRESTWSSED